MRQKTSAPLGLILAIGFAAILAFTSCSTTGQSGTSTSGLTPPTPEQLAPILRSTVAVSATLALNKNPRYIPAVQALAASIGVAVFATSDEITPQTIAAFISDQLAKSNVPPEERAIYITLGQQIYTNVVATLHLSVVKISDPRVALFIGAFRDGLNDAVSAVTAAHATPQA